ncbi:hypothetical protein BaRGS_00034381, partial [Batillaria attramentaria]
QATVFGEQLTDERETHGAYVLNFSPLQWGMAIPRYESHPRELRRYMVQDISMLEISDEEEDLLKRELETSTLRCLGQCEGGHVSDARTFLTDNGKVFAKINRNQQARQMFEGEAASLEALKALQVVKVPTPIKEFITRKMEQQVSHYEQVEGDRTVRVLWSQALPKVSRLFHGLEIRPSLLHGDLWDGNVAEDSYGPGNLKIQYSFDHRGQNMKFIQAFRHFGHM